MDFSIYKNARVLVTGHTGFKGSWLLDLLDSLCHDELGSPSDPDPTQPLLNLMEGDQKCNSIIADIRDADRLQQVIEEFCPDFIFHLAAQPLVRRSYHVPVETFEVNGMGTVYLLEAVRKLGKPTTVVLITTDKVYENPESGTPFVETDRLGGHDPYSTSKAVSELIIDSYRKSFFAVENKENLTGIASCRAGNVIGGGDWALDRLVPDIVRAFYENQTVTLRNPNAVRPWQHVLEPLVGYLLLGTKLKQNPHKYSEAFNFGPFPEDMISVEKMTRLALEAWGGGSYQIKSNPGQLHEAGLLTLSIDKAREELSWTPKLNSQQAIQWSIEWYKKQHLGKDVTQLMRDQIEQYLAL